MPNNEMQTHGASYEEKANTFNAHLLAKSHLHRRSKVPDAVASLRRLLQSLLNTADVYNVASFTGVDWPMRSYTTHRVRDLTGCDEHAEGHQPAYRSWECEQSRDGHVRECDQQAAGHEHAYENGECEESRVGIDRGDHDLQQVENIQSWSEAFAEELDPLQPQLQPQLQLQEKEQLQPQLQFATPTELRLPPQSRR